MASPNIALKGVLQSLLSKWQGRHTPENPDRHNNPRARERWLPEVHNGPAQSYSSRLCETANSSHDINIWRCGIKLRRHHKKANQYAEQRQFEPTEQFDSEKTQQDVPFNLFRLLTNRFDCDLAQCALAFLSDLHLMWIWNGNAIRIECGFHFLDQVELDVEIVCAQRPGS